MQRALSLAGRADESGEVPVGAVLVDGGHCIAEGWNQPIGQHDPSAHAEVMALRAAGQALGNYRLSGTTLYVTLEPCLMCYSALILAGIGNIVYAYEDVMGGGISCELSRLKPIYKNSPITAVAGVLRSESLKLFQAYFSNPVSDYWKNSLLAEYTLEQ